MNKNYLFLGTTSSLLYFLDYSTFQTLEQSGSVMFYLSAALLVIISFSLMYLLKN